jgi:hypothetical protein
MIVRLVAIGALVALASTARVEAAFPGKAKKPTTSKKSAIAAGKPCSLLGATAAGTNLDCVKIGKALQWQPRGSRINPFHLNDVAEYSSYETDRYRLKVTGTSALTAADIGAPDPNRPPIPAGSTPHRINAELTYLGPREVADPAANLSSYEVVDANDKKYGLYADQNCSQYTSKVLEEISLRAAPANTPQTTGFCVVVPSASIPTLLVHVFWIANREGLWFKTVA